MQFSFATLVAATLASLASAAFVQPSGNPSGNPTHTPSLAQVVPIGKPFAITWTPTTAGNVQIVLLRGPSTNVKFLAEIVASTPNTGSFIWTPPSSLTPDVTHYGIEIVDLKGQTYQYSPQFGIGAGSNSGNPTTTHSSTTTILSTYTVVIPTGTTKVPTSTSCSTTSTTTVEKTSTTTCSTTLTKTYSTTAVANSTTYATPSPTKKVTTVTYLASTAPVASTVAQASSSAIASPTIVPSAATAPVAQMWTATFALFGAVAWLAL